MQQNNGRLRETANFLGLAVEGIFRLSSAASEVDQLYREFDKPPTYGKYLDLSTYDIHAIAGVMKKYLRCLPEAVIPNTYHHLFLQAAGTTSIHCKQRYCSDRAVLVIDDLDDQGSPSPLIETLVSLVTQLPRAHRHLLHYIIQLASHVQRYSHVNMMNPEALAVVLAPVCTGFDQTLRDMRIMTLQTRHGSPLTSKNPASTIDRLVQLNAKWTYIWTHLIENREYLLKTWDAGSFDPLQLNHYWHPSSKPCIAQQSTPSTTSSGSTNSASPVPPYQILISQFQAEPETVQVAPPARVTQESSESGNDSSNYPKTSKHHQRYAVVVMRRRQQQNWIPSIDRVSKDDLDDTLPHRREDTSREASSSSLLRRHKSMVNLKKSVL